MNEQNETTELEAPADVDSLVMCGYCKDCSWRDTERYCTNENAMDEDYGQGHGDNDDKVIYSHQEGGGFKVGDNFGCVHFKVKNT